MDTLALQPVWSPGSEKAFELGTILDEDTPFHLTLDALRVHAAVLGGSGSGKSKLLQLLIRYLLQLGEGGLFIDPHGDTADDLMLDIAYRWKKKGDEALFRQGNRIKRPSGLFG